MRLKKEGLARPIRYVHGSKPNSALKAAVASANLFLQQILRLICLETNLQNTTVHKHGALFAQNL